MKHTILIENSPLWRCFRHFLLFIHVNFFYYVASWKK